MKWSIGLGLAVLTSAVPLSAQQTPMQPDSVSADSVRLLSHALVRDLPVDEAAPLLRFLPGFEVFDGQAWYRSRAIGVHRTIDGVPVRSFTSTFELEPPTGSLRSIAVTGMGAPAWVRGRGVEFRTATDAARLEAGARFGTDGVAPDEWNPHRTRIELAARGPIPGLDGLSFSFDANLLGNRYRQLPQGYEGDVYLPSGVDTVIRLPRAPAPDSVDVIIPSFERATYGELPLGNSDRNDIVGAMRFQRAGGDWLLRYQRTSITGMERDIVDLYNPDFWRGRDDAAQVLSLSGSHSLPAGLTFSGALSHQRYDVTRGVLDPAWANANTNPTFGIMGAPQFLADRDDYEVTDALLLALRSGSLPIRGYRYTTTENPLAVRRQGLAGVGQSLRLNPYAMRTSWYISGVAGTVSPAASWSQERRWYGRAALSRDVGPFGVTMGGELDRTTAESFTLPWVDGLPEAWRQKPEALAGFVDVRTVLAGARISAGMRAEQFSTDALLPRVPGFIVPDSLTRDLWVLRDGDGPWQERLELREDCGGAATEPARTRPGGQIVCQNNYVAVESETAVTPRFAAEYDIGSRLTARGGYTAYVQNPQLHIGMERGNIMAFPSAYEPVRENVMELGVTARTTADSWIDVMMFRHAVDNPLVVRTRLLNEYGVFQHTTNGNAVTTSGVELAARHVLSDWLGMQGQLTYSRTAFESDDGDTDSDTDPVRAAAIVAFAPGGLVRNGIAGAALADLTLHVTASYTGGPRYTPLANEGGGVLVSRHGSYIGTGGVPRAEINSERMPAWKQLDLRIAKSVEVFGSRAALFADLRNPFGIENARYIYAETGTTTNDLYRDVQLNTLLLNQTGTGTVQDMVIDEWPEENAVNRHMLRRAEARFGNGDGILTVAEMLDMWGAAFDLQQGPHYLVDRGRELRLGVELRF